MAGSVDSLVGLKENVIIGKLIPARSEIELPPLPEPVRMPDGELFEEYGGQSPEGLSEELMRELGFTTQEADSDLSEDSTTRVPAATVPQDLNVGYIAAPGDE